MKNFIFCSLFCFAFGVTDGRPQESFRFPDEDYPIFQPQSNPIFVPTTQPLPPTPTRIPAGSSTNPGVTTARPAPTTGSPAYIRCLSDCPTTSEYNPVCGTDQVSYNNRQRLDCANFCGPRINRQWTAIAMVRRGTCPTM